MAFPDPFVRVTWLNEGEPGAFPFNKVEANRIEDGIDAATWRGVKGQLTGNQSHETSGGWISVLALEPGSLLHEYPAAGWTQQNTNEVPANYQAVTPTGGLFRIEGRVSWLAGATDVNQRRLRIQRAAAATGPWANLDQDVRTHDGAGTGVISTKVSAEAVLAASTWIRMQAFQNSGNEQTIQGGAGLTWLAVRRIGHDGTL